MRNLFVLPVIILLLSSCVGAQVHNPFAQDKFIDVIPEASIGKSDISVENVPLDSTVEKSSVITNRSSEKIEFTLFSENGWITPDIVSGTIDPDKSITINVTLNTSGFTPALYDGKIKIKYNTKTENSKKKDESIKIRLTTEGYIPQEDELNINHASVDFGTIVKGEPASRTMTLSNSGSFVIDYSVSSGAAWLTFSPQTSGTLTQGDVMVLTLAADTSSLATGVQSANITISSTINGIVKNYTRTASINVINGTAALSLSPPSFTVEITAGFTTTRTINIGNTGNATLNWTLSSSQTWLTAGTSSGNVSPGGSSSDVITIDATSLTAGTYDETITVTNTDTSATSTVDFTVNVAAPPTEPKLLISKDSLTFSSVPVGTAAAATDTFTITNSGTGNLTWTLSDDRDWLTLDVTSGTNSGTITATVDTTALAIGTYNGTITVTSNDGNVAGSTAPIPVTLTVVAVPKPVLTVSESAFTVNDFVINTTTTRTFSITNSGNADLTWALSESSDWLVLPTTSSGTVTAGSTTSVTITLSAGASIVTNASANLTITSNDNGVAGSTDTVTFTKNVIDSSIAGKNFKSISRYQESRTKITFSGLPTTTATTITIYYYTSSSVDDQNLRFNGYYNGNLPPSVGVLRTYTDPAGNYTKGNGKYYIEFTGNGDTRTIYFWKISWNGGGTGNELYAETSAVVQN